MKGSKLCWKLKLLIYDFTEGIDAPLKTRSQPLLTCFLLFFAQTNSDVSTANETNEIGSVIKSTHWAHAWEQHLARSCQTGSFHRIRSSAETETKSWWTKLDPPQCNCHIRWRRWGRRNNAQWVSWFWCGWMACLTKLTIAFYSGLVTVGTHGLLYGRRYRLRHNMLRCWSYIKSLLLSSFITIYMCGLILNVMFL